LKLFDIAYFDRWQHADGLSVMDKASELTLTKLLTDADPDHIWPVLTSVHGYHIRSARDEIPQTYHVTSELLERCPQLLAVSANGSGYDPIDLAACTAAGVIAVNQACGNKEAVAEHTLGMMLALAKRIVESDRALRRDRDWHRNDYIGHDIYGKTAGIIGLGNIGRRVAQLCNSLFQMKVLAYDPYLAADDFRQHGVEAVAFEQLLQAADFVLVHCPRTAETMTMMGAEQFAQMKPEAYFITTARGGIHDETALYEALIAGRIAGAGLDVWDSEPPALDHPLLQLDNVIVSPHTAGVTHEARRQVAIDGAEQWRTIARGEYPPRLLNPEVWPQYVMHYREIMGRPVTEG
jgi:D-3-phosphoglycerate dehydrogenase